MDLDDRSPCEFIYGLFQAYAEWAEDDAAGGVPEAGVLQLLRDLNLLAGIPEGGEEAYAHEVMLRADVDHDGVLGINEFMLWLLTEAMAVLPLKRNGITSPVPLYNRYVSYALCDSWSGVRRKVVGMHMGAFLRLLKDQGITDETGKHRIAAQVAHCLAACDRTTGKMEGGTRMQFAQFVHCLQVLAERMRVSLDEVLYRVAGDGSHPPRLQPQANNTDKSRADFAAASAKPLLLSEVEESLKSYLHKCDCCGGTRQRWKIADVNGLKAYLSVAGMPYLPELRDANAPNVRSVFHEYCAAFNKGVLPKGSPGEGSAEPLSPSASGKAAPSSPSGAKLAHGGQQVHESPCCCQKRSLSLMEMQTFWALMLDLPTIRSCLEVRPRPLLTLFPLSSLTSERVDAAFLTACSIEGVYHADRCAGIHDKPVDPAQAKQLSDAALRIAARPWGKPGTKRPVHYGTQFEAAVTMSRRASGRVSTSHSAVSLSTTPPGGHAVSSLGTPSPITLARKYDSVPGTYAHRPATPTLTYPQFLEAIRLIAEDIVGHPQMQASVDMLVLGIVHEMSVLPCPCPKGRQQRAGPNH